MTKFMHPRFSVPIDNPNYDQIFKKPNYAVERFRDKFYIAKDGEIDWEHPCSSYDMAQRYVNQLKGS